MPTHRVSMRREEAPPPSRLPLILVLGGVILAAVTAGGVYFWQKKQQRLAVERAQAQAEEDARRKADEARRLVAERQNLLFQAVERHLFPTAEEWREAAAACQKAAALDPSCRQATSGVALARGALLALDGKPADAEVALREAVLEEDSIVARYVLAHVFLSTNHAVEAWGHFNEILTTKAGWAPALFGRGVADLEMGDAHKAAEGLRIAAEHWPDRPEVLAAYARSRDEANEPAEAITWYKKAVERGSRNAVVTRRLTTLLVEAGEVVEAKTLLGQWLESEPARVDLHVDLGRALLAGKERGAAEAELSHALELEPKNVDVHLDLARLYLEAAAPDRAKEVLEKAKTVAPDDSRPTFFLGHALLGLGLNDEARKEFAASCTAGIQAGCEEACYTGDVPSCRGVPVDRRKGVITELYSRRRGEARDRASYGHSSGYGYSHSSSRQEGGRVLVVGSGSSSSRRSSSPFFDSRR